MKRATLKAAAFWLATVAVLPVFLIYGLNALVVGRERAFQAATQLLALVPGLSGQYLRRAFLARTLAYYHPSATIDFGTIFSRRGARIEENAYLGPRCHIGLAHIGRDVLMAAGVHVPSGGQTHGTTDVERPIREQPGQLTMVRIGAGSWVGSAAVVMADVGRDTVVAAGAVVTRPLPDRVVAAGVPARVIRVRGGRSPVAANREPE